MSDPQRPHGLQPTRLLHPWDFPGKSTGVGCHCLLHRLPYPSPSPGVCSNSCPSMISNHLILCYPFSSCPQSFLTSGFFSKESVLHIRWPKYWSFSFSISPSNEYSGLISFRIDGFDLLAVQRTLRSFLQ